MNIWNRSTSAHIQLHIPIYREGIRHEIDKFKISKNTDRNWLKAGYRLFLPILEVIKKKLLRVKSILHIDETWTAVRIKLKGDCTKLGHYFKKYVAYAAKELINGNTDYESLAPWAIKLV